MLFAGDTLFAGSVGRTDFPGGDMTQLIQAIVACVEGLVDDTPDDAAHGRPGDSHQALDGGLAALLRKECDALIEGMREVAPSLGPSHLLCLHARTTGATDSAD